MHLIGVSAALDFLRNMTFRIVPAGPEIEYSEPYYESLGRTMGEERAAWARLPRQERENRLAPLGGFVTAQVSNRALHPDSL